MSQVSINPEIDSKQSDLPVHRIHGSQVTYRSYPATSYSNNSVQFSVVPPSMSTFMSRCIQVKFPLSIVYAGSVSDTSNLLLDDNYDSLRNLADMRIVLNQNININGQSLPSQQVYDVYPDIVAHFKRIYRQRHPLSAIDTTQVLADGVGTAGGPMSSYANSESYEGGLKRGAYTLTSITRSTTAATLLLDLVGWLYVPELFGLDQDNELGLIRIRNFDVNLTLDLSGKNVVTHATGGGDTISAAPTCTLTGQPSLLVKFTSVPQAMLPQGPLVYNHLRMERFPTAYGSALTANSSATIVGGNIQLPNVPRFAFVFVRESDSQKAFTSSDTFCAITNVSINFNNMSGLLSSASQFDLWNMSKETGLIDSYPQFMGLSRSSGFSTIGTVGSICALAFGKHISLGEGIEVGQAGAFNFNIQVTAKNVNQGASIASPVLYVVLAYDQSMVIDDGGMISLETPLARGVEGEVSFVPYHNSFDGGIAVGGSIGDFFKKVWNFLKNNKVISTVAKAVTPLVGMIPGYGPMASQIASTVGNVAEKIGVGYGGRQVAGQVLSKAELRKAIQRL